MTRQLIDFYETIEDIVKSDATKKVDLTYKASCEELNELQLTFNKVAKTINITNKVVKEGEEYHAILDYAEAYHIFEDFENQRQMGICLSNIAAIRFSIQEYEKANAGFDKAARFLEEEIIQNDLSWNDHCN